MMRRLLSLGGALCLALAAATGAESSPAEEAEAAAVSFAKDIAPILQQNCLACHRDKRPEGGLSLETSKSMLSGGDGGDLLVPGDAESSLLYARVSGLEEPIMPPEDNPVGASELSAKELQRVKRWIEQGAEFDRPNLDPAADWQPIPESVRSTYALAVSPDNRLVALAHANRVSLAHASTGQVLTRLADDRLPQAGTADVDLIGAIAFSPLGDRLATGGFRTVRIWKRGTPAVEPADAFASFSGPMALGPNGEQLAAVNAVGEVCVLSIEAPDQDRPVGRARDVVDLVWLDAQRLAIADGDGTIEIIQVNENKVLGRHTLEHPIVALAANGQTPEFAAMDASGRVRRFDLDGESTPEPLAAISDATAVAYYAPQGLAVGTATGAIQLFDMNEGTVKHQLQQKAAVTVLATGRAASTLLSGGRDGRVHRWDTTSGKQIQTLIGRPRTDLQIAAVEQGTERHRVWIEQLKREMGALEKRLETEEAALAKVAEQRDQAAEEFEQKQQQRQMAAKSAKQLGRQIAAAKKSKEDSLQTAKTAEQQLASTDREIKTLAAQLKPLQEQAKTANGELAAAEAEVAAAMKRLAVAKQVAQQINGKLKKKSESMQQQEAKRKTMLEKKNAAQADAEKAEQTIEQQTAKLAESREQLAELEKQTQKKRTELEEREQALVTATKTRDRAAENLPRQQDRIRRRRVRLSQTEQQLASLRQRREEAAAVRAVAQDPAGQRLWVLHADGELVGFDASSAQPIRQLNLAARLPGLEPTTLRMLPGRQLLIGRPHAPPVTVAPPTGWELERTVGGLDSELISDRVTALDFSPDGRSLAIGSGAPSRNGQVLLVGVRGGDVLRHWDQLHSDTVLCVRFSPEGDALATSASDKTIRVVDVASRQVLAALDGHTHHVLSLDWTRDGRTLVSGSADKTIKVWDARSGQQRRTIGGFADEVTSVHVLGSTSRVVSCCADGRVRLHDTGNGKALGSVATSDDFLFTLDLSSDGERAFAAGLNGQVHAWTVEGFEPLSQWEQATPQAR